MTSKGDSLRAIIGPAPRFRPSHAHIDRLKKYGASDEYISRVTADDGGLSVRPSQEGSGDRNPYRRARWQRVAFVSSALSAPPAIVLLVALPGWLERGSPLVLLAITVTAPLSFLAMLLVIYCIGWFTFRLVLARGIDKTYSTIEIIATFMPVQAAESYRAAKVQEANDESSKSSDSLEGSPVNSEGRQAVFRAGLRSTAISCILSEWRQELLCKDNTISYSPAVKIIRIAVAALSSALLIGFLLAVVTPYLMSIDSGAGIPALIAIQVGVLDLIAIQVVIGALTTTVSTLFYSR